MAQVTDKKRKILIMTDWFWPGYKAGGPIQAVVNYIHHMQQDYELYIVTSDRDLNAATAYPGITVDKWTGYGQSKVIYCSPAILSFKKIHHLIREVDPQFVYLNSLFSKYFTIYPLLLQWQKKIHTKMILAPRGMLRSSALQFKSFKKKIFLSLFKSIGLHKSIFFQATDETEWNDIRHHFGANVNLALAPDFPTQMDAYRGSIEKQAGELKIIFVGRLHPIKQLDYLLSLLGEIKGNILLTVTGSEEDKAHVENCKRIIQTFPPNIKVVFTGGMPNHELPRLLASHHLFALPTKGENFGHAIFEALSQGRPVLISNQTPWQQLTDYKAGWDLPLAQPASFKSVIEKVLAMDQQEYNEWSESAWKFAANYVRQSNIITLYKNLFN